jgi:mRNA interferase MazF
MSRLVGGRRSPSKCPCWLIGTLGARDDCAPMWSSSDSLWEDDLGIDSADGRRSRAAVRRNCAWCVRCPSVLTRDPMSRYLHGVISVPITHTQRGVSTEVRFTPDDGVDDLSNANLDNLQLLARELFVQRIGRARPETLSAVCQALTVAVACDVT